MLNSLSSCKTETEIKYEQAVIAGKALYENHCGNCHGKEGEGLRKLYPGMTAVNADKSVEFITCLIKTGTTDKEVNMPANVLLYDLDIAQIITYLKDKWGSGQKKIVATEEVAKVQC